jgi:hypothetical protein
MTFAENRTKNEFDLPDPLPASVVMDGDFYNSLKEKTTFELYTLQADFHPTDQRHLAAKRGERLCAVRELNGWVCGFVETVPNTYGFVPMEILSKEE